MKKCSNCSNQNIDTSNFCKKCGHKLDEIKNLCPNCKKDIEPNKIFCRHCGFNLSKISKTSKKFKIILFSLIGLLIVIVISFTSFYFLSENYPGKDPAPNAELDSSKLEESESLAPGEDVFSEEEINKNEINFSYVLDYADIIDLEHTDKIDILISDLKEKSSIEIYVVTATSIGDKTLDNYVSGLFTDLGLEENSDEISLFIVVLEENICRIEAGKNLTDIIASETLKEILDEYAIPELNIGEFGSGTYNALNKIIRKIYEVQDDTATSAESLTEDASSSKTTESMSTYIPQELIIDSENKAGVKVIIPETGIYEFSIIGGAYTAWQKEQNKGWLTLLSVFINKPLEFENTEYGPEPINADATIGFGNIESSYNEAENLGKGSSIIRNLNQNEYVILIIPDSYYGDNSGSIKIRIEKVD